MPTKDELEKELREVKELLGRLLALPKMIGTVVRDNHGMMTVLAGNTPLILTTPKGYKPRPGDRVLINSKTQGVEGVIPHPLPGRTALYVRALDDDLCEIEALNHTGERMIVYHDADLKAEEGDVVQMDTSNTIALRNLGKPQTKEHVVSETLSVSWDDVGGLDDIREYFAEVFETPILHPEIYSFYGRKPPKGVLMTGPPGCGKSLIAKAVATSITSRWRGSLVDSFISVKGPEVLSPYVGMAEQKIRTLFTRAKEFFKVSGFPAVIFIDEAESVMNRRGSGISSDVDRTVVPAFLAEMDGLEESGALVIVATNRPELLDPAITREGRIDRKIRIPRPNQNAATKIFSIHLRAIPLQGLHISEAADASASHMYGENMRLYDIEMKDGTIRHFRLSDVCSGAMIATICQQAAQRAMSRDIRQKTRTGVSLDDLRATVNDVRHQNLILEHKEDLTAFVSAWKSDIRTIRKAETNAEADPLACPCP